MNSGTWKSSVLQLVAKPGFSEEYVRHLGLSAAKSLLKQRLFDVCYQTDIGSLSTLKMAPFYKIISSPPLNLPSYFADLVSFDYRKAFTQARLDMLPLASLKGRYT